MDRNICDICLYIVCFFPGELPDEISRNDCKMLFRGAMIRKMQHSGVCLSSSLVVDVHAAYACSFSGGDGSNEALPGDEASRQTPSNW